MNDDQALYGLVLTGGLSQRMGTDKAMLRYRNQPQAIYLSAIIEQLGYQTFISCRKDDASRWAPYQAIEDKYTGIGPMAGIMSAFEQLPGKAFLVLACDYPLLRARDLEWLIDQRSPGHDITAVSLQSNIGEPLLAIWESSSHTVISELHANGNFRLMDALDRSRVRLVMPESLAYFVQANDPGTKKSVDEFLKRNDPA